MSQQQIALKITGLQTHNNELSEVPPGSLSKADNIVINRESVAEPRRGYNKGASFGNASDRANKIFYYQSAALVHYATATLGYTTDPSTGILTALSGTYNPPSATVKVRAAQANENFYFTTAAGVYKMDAYNATPKLSGASRALNIRASLPAVSTAAWLTNNYRVAYRVVWGYKDANNNLITSVPSQRESIKNTTGSTKDVQLIATIPSGVTTAWFYQVYRSSAIDNTSGDIEPNDELGLVYEDNPSSSDITNGYVTITDITPDELRGATIYTASSQEGLVNGNEQPPLAKDIAVFKNHLFYGNIISKHRYYLNLLATGGTSGLVVNDTLAVGGITYTAKNAEDVASAQFRVYYSGSFTFVDADVSTGSDTITENSHPLQDGDAVTLSNSGGALPTGLSAGTTYYVVSRTTNTFKLATAQGGSAVDITAAAGGGTHTLSYGGSASQNIRDTALSLVHVINRHASSTVTASYLSGPDDLPGKMLLEEEGIGGSSFAVISSRATCWSPSLPTSGTSESSTNSTNKNGVMYSKASQPEAVPLANIFYIGSAAKEILRLIPLRDSLFVLKEDGIYRISGETGNFRVDLVDETAKLLAAESAVVLNNQIFALTDQGVVTITESGVQAKSWPIESTILGLQGVDLDALRNITFGISYESERKYILFVPSVAGDTYPTQAYVYNTFTNAWTRWILNKSCGAVNPVDDKLCLGAGNGNYINQERKTFSFTDHVDYGSQVSITAIDDTTLTLTTVEDVAVGDVIYQSSSIFSIVSSVDLTANTVEVEFAANFTVASADVLKAISSAIAWVPFTLGNPGILKQFREASLLFKQDFTGDAEVVFTSDISPSQEAETISGSAIGLWGLFAWGSGLWGGSNNRRPIRILVPRAKQRCSQLTVEFQHSTAYAPYQLTGLSLVVNPGSERIAR